MAADDRPHIQTASLAGEAKTRPAIPADRPKPPRPRFDDWRKAGFDEELLPIIPPGAAISACAGEGIPNGRGKLPGVLHSDGWSGHVGWRTRVTQDRDLRQWAKWGGGVGVRNRLFPAIDVDIDDHRIADIACSVLQQLFGHDLPVRRRGTAARFLVLFRLSAGQEPMRKVRRTVRCADGKTHAVEFLGLGQQCVVDGVHPSFDRYRWSRRPRATTDVPEMNAEILELFWSRLEEALRAQDIELLPANNSGRQKHVRSTARMPSGSTRRRSKLPCEQLQAECDDLVIEAIRHWGTNNLDYDGWIRLMIAAKAAARDPEMVYPAVEAWALGWPANTRDTVRAKWNSITDASVGAAAVYRHAYERSGWEPRSTGSGAGESGNPSQVRAAGRLRKMGAFDRFVYVRSVDRLFELATGELVAKSPFNNEFASAGFATTGKYSAWDSMMSDPACSKVQALGFRPGADQIFVDRRGRTLVNQWVPPLFPAERLQSWRSARQYLAHLGYLIPNRIERHALLCWLAHWVQRPGERVTWHPLLVGGQGVGKSMLFRPLSAWAPRTTTELSSHAIAGPFQDLLVGKDLVLGNELVGVSNADYQRMKPLMADPTLTINPKGLPAYTVENHLRFLCTTNSPDAVGLEEDDRRFLISGCARQPKRPEYYEALVEWMGANVRAVIGLLAGIDLSSFKPTAAPAVTAAKSTMIEMSRTPLVAWVMEQFDQRQPPFDRPIVRADRLEDAVPRHLRSGSVGKRVGHVLAARLSMERQRLTVGKTKVSVYALTEDMRRLVDQTSGRKLLDALQALENESWDEEPSSADDNGLAIDPQTVGDRDPWAEYEVRLLKQLAVMS